MRAALSVMVRQIRSRPALCNSLVTCASSSKAFNGSASPKRTKGSCMLSVPQATLTPASMSSSTRVRRMRVGSTHTLMRASATRSMVSAASASDTQASDGMCDTATRPCQPAAMVFCAT